MLPVSRPYPRTQESRLVDQIVNHHQKQKESSPIQLKVKSIPNPKTTEFHFRKRNKTIVVKKSNVIKHKIIKDKKYNEILSIINKQ